MTDAYFAGGCFWCITPAFEEMKGVSRVISGYSGGVEIDPTYEAVKQQKTGHRETIRIIYDERIVDYQSLLEIFLSGVDPFDAGGQFIDRGHSYTLAIYYRTEEERLLALRAISKLERESGRKVFIAVEPFCAFYDAEEYHQDFYKKNPEAFERELIESGRKKG